MPGQACKIEHQPVCANNQLFSNNCEACLTNEAYFAGPCE
jgi:hypothetical protein